MENTKLSHLTKSVLVAESEAILTLSNTLDNVFLSVVERVVNCSGRIILTGIGKSNHIAKKISSTLSSTGTPSFFIHPTEASHGDLGMIKEEDILIAFSRSGESTELLDLLNYCNDYSVPIVGITAKKNSTLYKHSNFKILLPDVPEACPLGLAPTTSSIMMLALGDALAIACLEKKKFHQE